MRRWRPLQSQTGQSQNRVRDRQAGGRRAGCSCGSSDQDGAQAGTLGPWSPREPALGRRGGVDQWVDTGTAGGQLGDSETADAEELTVSAAASLSA